MKAILDFLRPGASEGIVPRSGVTAGLTLASAAAMAFLAVFVLALALSAGRQAAEWEQTLVDTATVRISGDLDAPQGSIDAVEIILSQTPGIGATRLLTAEEQSTLLAPWFGEDLPVDALRLPTLIEVELVDGGPDAAGLQQRLSGEVPGAVFDDHGRWRAPMVEASRGLRSVAATSLVLIFAISGVTVALAASAALSANRQVIDVLRLVGAEDRFISRAFTRRFTALALLGAAAGAAGGMLAVALIPRVAIGSFAGGVGFVGGEWIWPILVPFAAAALAYGATRLTASRRLKEAG